MPVSIPYSRVISHDLLAIDATDVVTEARVVVLPTISGLVRPSTFYAVADGEAEAYYPLPWVQIEQAGDHSTYQAKRSIPLEGVVAPYLPGSQSVAAGDVVTVIGFTGAGDEHIDDDGSTTTDAATGQAQIALQFQTKESGAHGLRAVGARLIYAATLIPTEKLVASIVITHSQPVSAGNVSRSAVIAWTVPDTQGQSQALEVYAPTDIRMGLDNSASPGTYVGWDTYVELSVNKDNIDGGGALSVAEFHPLIVDTSQTQPYALARLRSPASDPRRIVIDPTAGEVMPEDELTITDWLDQPGTDLVRTIAQATYHEDRTIIDLEQAGPLVRQGAREQAFGRALGAALRRTTDRASGAYKMGERQ